MACPSQRAVEKMPVIVSQPNTLKPGQALLAINGQPDLDPGSLRLAVQQAGKFRFLQSNRVGDAWGTTRTWLWPEGAWREDDVLYLILGQDVAWNLMANITYLLHLADDFSELGTPERMAWKAIRLPSDPPAPVDEGHSPVRVRPTQSTPISTQSVPKPEPAPSSLLLTQEAEIREDSDDDAQRISGRPKGASGQQKSLVPAWGVVALGLAAIAVPMAIPIFVSGSADNHAGMQKVSPPTAETASMPARVSDHEICSIALNGVRTSWDQRDAFVNTVAEARRRGLTVVGCRQKLGLASAGGPSPQNGETKAAETPKMTDTTLCTYALNPRQTNWDLEYGNMVTEAKRRGLNVVACQKLVGLKQPKSATDFNVTEDDAAERGLEFESITFARCPRCVLDGLSVYGEVVNYGSKALAVPPIRVAQVDAGWREIKHNETVLAEASLRIGQRITFSLILPDVPEEPFTMTIAFLGRPGSQTIVKVP